jgi:hypothetical protein
MMSNKATIVNLTQHVATATQVAVGVIDLDGQTLQELKCLLTFQTAPTHQDLERVATDLAIIAAESGATHATIGGAPYLMGPLEAALKEYGVIPVYSFSMRKSVETIGADGTVTKTAVFEHAGWVGL